MYIGKWSIHRNRFGRLFSYYKLSTGFLIDILGITVIYPVSVKSRLKGIK